MFLFFDFVQPMQYKLDPRLARLLGVHTQTRPVIINALWQYIKTHKLQDAHEREYINCDKYMEQVLYSLIYKHKYKRTKITKLPMNYSELFCTSTYDDNIKSHQIFSPTRELQVTIII